MGIPAVEMSISYIVSSKLCVSQHTLMTCVGKHYLQADRVWHAGAAQPDLPQALGASETVAPSLESGWDSMPESSQPRRCGPLGM